MPIYDGEHGPTLLMIRRTETINHPGQVAFPGGRPEPGDSGPLATALREAHEELGIDPQSVRVLGSLPVVETMTSNYSIFPFVGRLAERPTLRPQASEVAAVLDVPLGALTLPGLPIEAEWELPLPGERPRASRPSPTVFRSVRYFPWADDKIWGATERMLELLLAAISEGTIRL